LSVVQQGVALTGRNTTGPPCIVGRLTAHAPGGQPARPPAALSPVHTSNNVDAAISKQLATLLLVWLGF